MPKSINLLGRVFGRLTPLSRGRGPNGRLAWVCQCSCGNASMVPTSKLLSGHTGSCGCYQREVARAPVSHGHTTGGVTRTYVTWASMLSRCADKTNFTYGGGGVEVCERWRTFENFLVDMGERPKGMSIDRISNSLGYEPANCRWADRVVQSNNRTITKWLTHEGRTQSIAAWCHELCMPYQAVYSRLHRGWSAYDALMKPTRAGKFGSPTARKESMS